ncbi:hypothetical protein FH972_022158 [Carpinus fangiana]|uniref:F-box domain-containing protein n=1 Tax=Carpinus fangiana TaxID=176857 RepID=A0A5N6KRY6_9ROSI|nr:hypothetical protein FH972_022158 [Carpinus fangiana]
MDSLPNEIVESICWEVDDIKDLASLRLTSKCLSACATPAYFYDFTLYVNSDSYAKLEAICRHDFFRKLVRCLHYSADMVRYYAHWEDDFEIWNMQAVGAGLGLPTLIREQFRATFTDEQLRSHWEQWKEVTTKQAELLEPSIPLSSESLEVYRLCTCLKSLPNLQNISWHGSGSRGHLEMPIDFYAQIPELENLPTPAQSTLVARDPLGSKRRHGKQILAILGAIYLAKSSSCLRSLKCLRLDSISAIQFATVSQVADDIWVEEALSNISHFELKLRPNLSNYDTGIAHNITMMLGSANRLRTMRLTLPHTLWPWNVEVPELPQLTALDLDGFTTTPSFWKSLTAHVPKLQCVCLSNLGFQGPNKSEDGGPFILHPWLRVVSGFMDLIAMETIALHGYLKLEYADEESDDDIDYGSDDDEDEEGEDQNEELNDDDVDNFSRALYLDDETHLDSVQETLERHNWTSEIAGCGRGLTIVRDF